MKSLTNNNYHFTIINQESKLPLQDNPGIFVDGALYSNLENLAKIRADKLDRIEVVWNKYFYKDFTFGGITGEYDTYYLSVKRCKQNSVSFKSAY